MKLFILGLPGSGKSTISRHITEYTQHKGWEIFHFSDHKILKEMFQADIEHHQFQLAEHGGFDVLDNIVCDIALQLLEQKVDRSPSSSKQERIDLIEFARNDYRWAFQQFSVTFLQEAYFIYLDVERDIRRKRINERVANPNSEDDFFVSEYIFDTYYGVDDGRAIPQILTGIYGLEKQKVKSIDNNGSLADSIVLINQFVDMMCGFASS